MKFLSFIKENKTFLRFGLLLTLFSSFGQTFLIALYVPSLLEKFGFTNGEFGGLYGMATLASAFSLTFIGKLIDRYPLERFTMANALFMAASLSITALAPDVVILFIGLWGLRLSGQGLMSHIAITSISRYFDHSRGKA